MKHTPAEILSALDADFEDLKRDENEEDWPWSGAAAQLIRAQQDKIEYYGSMMILAYEFMERLRPELVAGFITRQMESGNRYDATAARRMAQFFIETNDDIGRLLDSAAERFDASQS